MYGLSLVLVAYAVAQLVRGDGFLAAFFATLPLRDTRMRQALDHNRARRE